MKQTNEPTNSNQNQHQHDLPSQSNEPKTQTLKNPIEKYFQHVTPYHYYTLFFIFLAKLPVFWHVISLIFLSPPMKFTCKGTNSSGDQCPCAEPIWDKSVFTQTMQTKYGIVCERAWLVSLSQSMVYVGSLLGAFSFGFLSDKFGRLPSFTMSCLTIAVSGCLVTVMPTAACFIFMRCIEGLGVGGAIVTGYVLCVEYCGVGYREMVSALYHIPINLGHTSMAGLSYLMRDSDTLQLAVSIPMFFFVVMWWVCLESPKWLLDKGYVAKATVVMEKIQKFNRKPTDMIKRELEEYHAQQTASMGQTNVKFWQIFNHRKLTINLLCMSVIYFVCGMGYYGVSQYIGKMSGNIHVNVAMSGAMLIPGSIATAFLLQSLGRRIFLMSTSLLSGVFMIIVVIVPKHAIMGRVIFACICNTFFFMSFIIVFLYGCELFPTSIRNSVLGFLSVMSRVGQITAPPINALPQTVSGIIFGLMAITGGLLCYPLPETKNTELPSTLSDTKSMPRRLSKPGAVTKNTEQPSSQAKENVQ